MSRCNVLRQLDLFMIRFFTEFAFKSVIFTVSNFDVSCEAALQVLSALRTVDAEIRMLLHVTHFILF